MAWSPNPRPRAARRPLRAQVPLRRHLREDRVATLQRPAGVQERVVVGGGLRQPGEQRRLHQAQLPDRPGEVDLGGGLDPDERRAFDRPVGGGVEVLTEDFLARVLFGVLDRQLRLDDLAFEAAPRVAEAEFAHQLLGDRRAALDRFARFQVLERGAGDALEVDAAVFVEALVLDRDRGQPQSLRHPFDRHRLARFVGVDEAEPAAVGGEEGGVAAALDLLAGGERRRFGGDVEHPRGDRDRRQDDGDEQAGPDEDQLAAGAAAPPLTSPIALGHLEEGYFGSPGFRPGCPRSRGCGRSPRPAAGSGSRPRCRRRG